jgi:hypothetical protein
MPASTTVVAPITAEHAQVLDNLAKIEEGVSLLGAEAHDGLAIMSNGSLASETPQAANVVVTGALAFQQNAVSLAATQLANQVSSLVNGVAPQQLMDRVFLAMARWADAPADQALDAFVDAALNGKDWLAIPTGSSTVDAQSDSSLPAEQTSADQGVASERVSVVDSLFAQLADETNDFGDLGDN